MVRMIGKCTVKLGQSSGDKETLANVKRIIWEPIPREYRPQTVMNTVNPLGFHRPHKHLRGEIHVLSEAYEAFYHNGSTNKAYIIPNGDNVEIPYFVAEETDEDGNVWIYTFTGVVPIDDPGIFADGEDVVHVYPFVAKYVTPTKPS